MRCSGHGTGRMRTRGRSADAGGDCSVADLAYPTHGEDAVSATRPERPSHAFPGFTPYRDRRRLRCPAARHRGSRSRLVPRTPPVRRLTAAGGHHERPGRPHGRCVGSGAAGSGQPARLRDHERSVRGGAPASEVLTSVGTPVGDLLGGEQPAPGGPTPLPAPVPRRPAGTHRAAGAHRTAAPAELPTGNTQEITEPPELTELPAPADLPTGNQLKRSTEAAGTHQTAHTRRPTHRQPDSRDHRAAGTHRAAGLTRRRSRAHSLRPPPRVHRPQQPSPCPERSPARATTVVSHAH